MWIQDIIRSSSRWRHLHLIIATVVCALLAIVLLGLGAIDSSYISNQSERAVVLAISGLAAALALYFMNSRDLRIHVENETERAIVSTVRASRKAHDEHLKIAFDLGQLHRRHSPDAGA